MPWTDDRVEQLKRMWSEGLTASQIAARIGNGVTRNAVIGKVHRLRPFRPGGQGLARRSPSPQRKNLRTAPRHKHAIPEVIDRRVQRAQTELPAAAQKSPWRCPRRSLNRSG